MPGENLPRRVCNRQTIFTYNHWLAALVKGKCSSTKPTRLATGVVCHLDSGQNRPYKIPWPCRDLNRRPTAPQARTLPVCHTTPSIVYSCKVSSIDTSLSLHARGCKFEPRAFVKIDCAWNSLRPVIYCLFCFVLFCFVFCLFICLFCFVFFFRTNPYETRACSWSWHWWYYSGLITRYTAPLLVYNNLCMNVTKVRYFLITVVCKVCWCRVIFFLFV